MTAYKVVNSKPYHKYIEFDNYIVILITKRSKEVFEVLVDKADWELVKDYAINVQKGGKNYYARILDSTGTSYMLHRVLLNVPEDLLVDHVDCNGLNNRRDNLRPATRSENGTNRISEMSNTTYGKGVSAVGSLFQAKIQVDGKRHSLGYFKSPDKALDAVSTFNAQNVPFSQEALKLKEATNECLKESN